MLTEIFQALLEEAQFTKEMLGAGATQIRLANYASKGIYFQAFTSLSTGLERVGKICLLLDHFIDNDGTFPNGNYFKKDIGHKIVKLFEKSTEIVSKRNFSDIYLQPNNFNSMHAEILKILNEFAIGERYSNINFLTNSTSSDPIKDWHQKIDLVFYDACVTDKKKNTINAHANIFASMFGGNASVLYTSETGGTMTDLKTSSIQTGIFESVAPYRQLYILQIIRYWTTLLSALGDLAQQHREKGHDIPFFREIFAIFYNSDQFFTSRKKWDRA